MRSSRIVGSGFGILAAVAVVVLVLGVTASADRGDTTRVSVSSEGAEGNGFSNHTSISADGRYIAFNSLATNMVGGDTNEVGDVFVHDTKTDTTTRVSTHSDGTQGDGRSLNPAISADGRYIAFTSYATNLVDNDTNEMSDVFVHDTQTGTTTRVSIHTDGNQADGGSYNPAISADGRHISFQSDATNLVDNDTNEIQDVFVHDTQTGTTTRVSIHTDGTQGDLISGGTDISADGRYIAFTSYATNLTNDDTNGMPDALVHDTQTGTTTRVSIHTDGTQGNERSLSPAISADGSHIAFYSFASNLVDNDTNGISDVFIHDTTAGITTTVSLHTDGTQGNSDSGLPAISADGRYIAFHSYATNLTDNDANGWPDVFVYDTQTDTTTRISDHTDGTQGDNISSFAAISADGRYVTFESLASNLVDNDTNGVADVFVHQYLADPPPPSTTTTTTAPSTPTPPPTMEPPQTTEPPPTTTTTTVPDTPSTIDYFVDDNGHLFEDDINAIAAEGITIGCNPPVNNWYCPDEPFLRGQAAAYLRRALSVPAASQDYFTDDEDSVFEDDINAIAQAGITRGCNPPENTHYCPEEIFLRGQAAAFVRRGLSIPFTTEDFFVDDENSVFEDDINAIAKAGITRGCNPPVNDHYCPDRDPFLRGQAAAFMRRALLP